jgi:transposase-like protein
MTRSQRIENAHKLFARGYSNADVAREIGVHADTATTYRRLYEEGLNKQAASNPHIFSEVLLNTQRALIELDQIRTNAWEQIQRTRIITVQCEHCGEDTESEFPISDQSRVQYQNVILKAQHERAQLYQLLTSRTEILVRHEHTKIVQERILGWLKDNLSLSDREKLAVFIETQLSEFMGELPAATDPGHDIVDAELV